MLDNDTKRRIDSARQILVGKVPDPKAQVEQITTAMIYKFMDDMDQESIELGGKSKFFANGYEQYAWSKLLSTSMSGFERLSLYVEAITKMSQNPHLPQLFRNIFKDAFLPYRDPETLNLFLKEINGFVYDHSERLGDAFEYLLSVLGSQGDAGQFRTPRHIIKFIVEAIDPKKDETVLDPACGTAGFLISAYKHIMNQNKTTELTPDEKDRLMNNFMGYDISPDMVKLSLVNMYLHQFPNPNIYEYDTLTSEDKWDETYDVILANPPFMSPKGGIRPHKRFSVQAKRSEVLFVDYIAEHLNINGRAGVIVPEGIIFQSQNAYKALRKMLVENYLYAVVSLPAGVFQPYSGVKTSILLMDKTIAKKSNDILFVKIYNDGYGLGAQRREIDKNDLPIALQIIKEYVLTCNTSANAEARLKEKFNINSLWNIVPKDNIAEDGDYNFSAERYKSTPNLGKNKFERVSLNDVCELQSGSRQKGGSIGNGIPSIGGEQISSDGNIKFDKMKFITPEHYSTMNKGILQKNDVLIVKDGATTGKTAFYDGSYTEAAINEHVFLMRSNDKIESFLLYNIIRSDRFQQILQKYIKGIIGGISLEIKQIQIPLPPLEVQQEIVAEIDGYQKIIDGARQVVENYKPQIKIDPDWPMVELGKVCEIKTGGTPSRKKDIYWNGNIPWVGSKVCKNLPVYEADEFITESGLKNSSAKLLKTDSTLIALVGATIGKTAWLKFESTTNQNIAALYPRDDVKLSPAFLYYISQTLYHLFMKLGDGKFRMANLNFIQKLKIPLPSIKEQKGVVDAIQNEFNIIQSNKKLINIFEQKIQDRINEVWGE